MMREAYWHGHVLKVVPSDDEVIEWLAEIKGPYGDQGWTVAFVDGQDEPVSFVNYGEARSFVRARVRADGYSIISSKLGMKKAQSN